MQVLCSLIAFGVVCCASLRSQQWSVVPAAFANTDAMSFVWVPGACADVHQQILIGASHLSAMVGHALTALEFRRTAANELYLGGATSLTVALSISPRSPLDCSEQYVANSGPSPVQVFHGTVAIPSSPAVVGNQVPWSTQNVIHIAFQQPFIYSGGTLCVDVTGTTVAGQIADWWMADAAFDSVSGSASDLGPGCGQQANALGQWSHVDPRSLLPGAQAAMSAHGPAGNWVIAAVGPAGPSFPLDLVGLGQAGCFGYLSDVWIVHVAQFVPFPEPELASLGGGAELRVRIPNEPWVLGGQLATQWLDMVAGHASNAVLWSIAPTMPSLDMALVDGVAGDSTGNVLTYRAHVLRFEYQ